jgi:hypothetical protein
MIDCEKISCKSLCKFLFFFCINKLLQVATLVGSWMFPHRGFTTMEGGKMICYHFEIFHGGVLNYPTYDKEIYALVQAIKKWKNYIVARKIFLWLG